MSDSEPLADESLRVLTDRVLPTVFSGVARSEHPTFMLLVAQPGASAARGMAVSAGPQSSAFVSARDLRAFHPRFSDAERWRSPDAMREVAEASAEWLSAAIRYARQTKRALALDGTLLSRDAALATTEIFASSGFATHIAVTAVPRHESLLAVGSRECTRSQRGLASERLTVAQHDGALRAVRELVAACESGVAATDRLTVVASDGAIAFDAHSADEAPFHGASEALAAELGAPSRGPEAMRWLSELRAVTDYAVRSRPIPASLAEILVELHRAGVEEVLPALDLPQDSLARPAAQAALRQQLEAVLRASASARVATPAPQPSVEPERDLDRSL